MSLITTPLQSRPQSCGPCLCLSRSFLLPADMYSFSQVHTASRVCARAHSFPHSDTYTDPQPSWLSCTESRPPPPPFPCIFTHRLIHKCNTHASSPLTQACMRTHFLSLPSLSFLCLSQTRPLPGEELCCRSGSSDACPWPS